jgi:hypothetical protein
LSDAKRVVFSKRDRLGWLAKSLSSGARGDEIEGRSSGEAVTAVLVRVACQDAVDAEPVHLQEAVLSEVGVAGVIEGFGKGPGEPDALVELADGEQPGVAGELALGGSTWRGVPKKSRKWGQAEGILID